MDRSPTSQRPTRPAYPRLSETLGNDSQVRIRPLDVRRDPAQHVMGESTDQRTFRLVGHADQPSGPAVDPLDAIDYVDEVVFVGITPDESHERHERIVGVSRFRTDQGGLHCECMVAVSDAWQKKGLAVLLMKHLIEVARANGIRRMSSVELTTNVAMRDLATRLGFSTRMDPGDVCQLLHELDLGDPFPTDSFTVHVEKGIDSVREQHWNR